MIGAFAGSATGIGVTIGAVDATAATFRGVAGRVSAFRAQIASVGASLKAVALSALPVVGVAGAIRAATSAFREMGDLSDRAADVGTSAPALQKLVGAMGQIGVRSASLDTVSRAMQNMARTTGEVGAEGFARVLGTAARFGSEAERLDFLSKAFGRTQGMVFAQLVRDGDEGVRKLVELAGGYPAVSDAAVQAGDNAADAMARAGDAIKAGWAQMLGELVIGFEGVFGPLPEVAAAVSRAILASFKAVADAVRLLVLVVRVPLEIVSRAVATIVTSVGYLAQAAVDSSYSFRDAFRDIGSAARDQWDDMLAGFSESAEGLFDFSNIGANAETAGLFDGMKNAAKQGGVTFRNEAEKAITETASAISNAFSKGGSFALKGSNEAAKIIRGSATGSAAQSQRTVTQFLPRIAQGIERTVAGIDDMVSTFDDLEVI